ncbi:MAG: hypothetical protein PHQ34_12415, partial [Methanothrix sp.]|nr:hypothetical protein [Methanothrix sp.]
LTGLFSRPKSEDVKITYNEFRYEPFWHIACNVHYEYDRTRSYNVPVIAPEVKSVTVDGKNYTIAAEPRQFAITGTEHCMEESGTEIIFDAVRGKEQKWEKYLRFDKETVIDIEKLSSEGCLVVMPEMRASAAVRQVLASMLRPIQADIVHEEKATIHIVDLYFRPVYAFEYKWEPKGKTMVVEFDGLTGVMTSGGITLRQQFEKMITRDLIFDVGADAANLLLPGSSIAFKVAKSMVDGHKVPEKR